MHALDGEPERVSAIERLGRGHGLDPYSDYARVAMAYHHVGRALLPGTGTEARDAHLREALGFLEGLSARGLPRDDEIDELRGELRRLLEH